MYPKLARECVYFFFFPWLPEENKNKNKAFLQTVSQGLLQTESRNKALSRATILGKDESSVFQEGNRELRGWGLEAAPLPGREQGSSGLLRALACPDGQVDSEKQCPWLLAALVKMPAWHLFVFSQTDANYRGLGKETMAQI